MEIIDSQIHIWEKDHVGRPWDREFAVQRNWGASDAVTFERAIGAMDAVGVDAALLTSCPLYHDLDYPIQAFHAYPERFRIVAQIDLSGSFPEQQVEQFQEQAGAVAIRIFLPHTEEQLYRQLRERAFEPIFRTSQRHGLPVMLSVMGRVAEVADTAKSQPDVQLVIDHLGMLEVGIAKGLIESGRRETTAVFESLDDLLSLAIYPNVAIKLSGVPTASNDAYPYADLWPHLHRIVEAFGVERLMWGSNFSRTHPTLTYAEGLNYIRETNELSANEKELILGENARRLLPWNKRLPSSTAKGGTRGAAGA